MKVSGHPGYDDDSRYPDECTGPFSDARDCPVHDPARRTTANRTVPSYEELRLLSWAARLVRLVAAGECPRTLSQFDEQVCEPIRRIALEMRDASQAALSDTSKLFVLLSEIRQCINDDNLMAAHRKIRAIEELLRDQNEAHQPTLLPQLIEKWREESLLLRTRRFPTDASQAMSAVLTECADGVEALLR